MNLQTIIVMRRISFTPLALLLAALTLAACESVDIEAAVQRSTPIDSEALPADVRLATAAVAMAMKGYGPGEVQGVAFADGAPNACKFVGHLVFQDVGNRRIIVGFVATYSVEADRIIVWEATTGTVTLDRPTASWFLVPAAKVPAGLFTENGHADILQFATKNGLGVVAPEIMQTPAEYYVVGFALDRLAAGDSIEFFATATGQATVAQFTINIDGWFVGASVGTFAPADLGVTLGFSALLATEELRVFGAAIPIATLAAMPANPYKLAPAP